MGFDRQGGVTWTNNYFKAVKNQDMELAASMQTDIDDWAMDNFVRILDGCEFLDEVVEGVSRRCGLVEGYVSVPANVTAARVMFKNLATAADRTLDAPRLKRRARLIIIGGAAVAAAAYAYHRYRRAAKRAEDLEAVKSLLAGGDSAVSLDDAAVTQQR